MAVAFLGLGAIGTPMAAHLASRGPLVVWNRTAARASEFASAHGVRAAGTPPVRPGWTRPSSIWPAGCSHRPGRHCEMMLITSRPSG